MKSRFTLALSALILLPLTGCAAQAPLQAKHQPLETSAFYGHWRVTGVAVSDSGIQALVDNDPSLMSRGLSFTHESLAWDASANAAEDTCTGPVFKKLAALPGAEQQPQLHKLGIRKAVPYDVHCQSGSWGPVDGESPAFFLAPDGSLALLWYDGGMLKLVKNK